MASESDKQALKALMELIDRADAREPTERDGIARRLATYYGRPDLRDAMHNAVRKTVHGRLETGGLKAPKVVYAVMDNGIVVLGGFDWSGFMKTESAEFDLAVRWRDVQKVIFRFPDYLGGLGIETTDRIGTETGPFEIVVAASGCRPMGIVPDDDVTAFAGAARETARMLHSTA